MVLIQHDVINYVKLCNFNENFFACLFLWLENEHILNFLIIVRADLWCSVPPPPPPLFFSSQFLWKWMHECILIIIILDCACHYKDIKTLLNFHNEILFDFCTLTEHVGIYFILWYSYYHFRESFSCSLNVNLDFSFGSRFPPSLHTKLITDLYPGSFSLPRLGVMARHFFFAHKTYDWHAYDIAALQHINPWSGISIGVRFHFL